MTKKNRFNAYWRIIKVRVCSIKIGSIKIFCPLGTYFLPPGSYFELYQVFMLNLFKYFDQKNQTFLSKNVSITSDQNMTQVAKYVPRGVQNVSIPPIWILITCSYIIFYWLIKNKNCLFFKKFCVLCFLVTPFLRFVLLLYYRRSQVRGKVRTGLGER